MESFTMNPFSLFPNIRVEFLLPKVSLKLRHFYSINFTPAIFLSFDRCQADGRAENDSQLVDTGDNLNTSQNFTFIFHFQPTVKRQEAKNENNNFHENYETNEMKYKCS